MREPQKYAHKMLTFAHNRDIMILKGRAGTVQVIQQGESPCPTKRSEQSVLSLEAEVVRCLPMPG